MFNDCWHAIIEQPFRGSKFYENFFFIEKVNLKLGGLHQKDLDALLCQSRNVRRVFKVSFRKGHNLGTAEVLHDQPRLPGALMLLPLPTRRR